MIRIKQLLVVTCLLPALSLVQCNQIKKSEQTKISPPNIIFMIGDGMGLAQISLAIEHAKDNLTFAQCKHIGFIKTSSIDDYITDSAVGATAFATGKKTKNAYISVDSSGKSMQTILELAESNNWLSALVVTSSITHATPACFFAHQKSRYDNLAFAQDFLNSGVDYAIGAGMPYFDSLSTMNRNVGIGLAEIANLNSDQWVGFNHKDSLSVAPVLKGGMGFLPQATQIVLDQLDKRNNPFFLMVEGSQIDWGGHDNDADYVTTELLDFNAAIKSVLNYMDKHPNTLLVVTADHETGGLSLLDDSQNKMVPHFSSSHHSGIMVPVFAFGKGADNFSGIYENTDIYYKLKRVMGF